MVLAGSPSAAANKSGVLINYVNFDNPEGLVLNGSAITGKGNRSAHVLRLTGNVHHQTGAAWSSVRVDTSQSFTTTFDVSLGNNGMYADGIAFVVQGEGPGASGWDGGGMGYRNIAPSVAVEFDTYQNVFDPDDNHVAVAVNGDVFEPLVSHPAPLRMSKAIFRNTVGYDAPSNTLRVWQQRPDGSTRRLVIETTVDLPELVGSAPAYVGFAGGTGSALAPQDVVKWTLVGTS